MTGSATNKSDAPKTGGTVDDDEIERFSAIAEEWWNPEGDFRPLHAFNPVRVGFVRDRLAEHFGRDPLRPEPLRGLRLLDIGCGGGLLAEPMTRLGASVTAIDAAEKSIGVAKVHAKRVGLDIDYRVVPPEALADLGETFDAVLNMEVVEHVADVDRFLSVSAALVKPGGCMVVATLNRTLKSLALAKIGAEYLFRWLPIGTHDWKKFVKPSELARGLRPHGLHPTCVKGMEYKPLANRFRLGPDTDVNYLAFFTKN